MASFRFRNGKWQAQVRRQGYRATTKSFTNKTDAQKWARRLETDIENGNTQSGGRDTLNTPLKNYLQRYLVEIAPLKASFSVEKYILKIWMESSLAKHPIGSITPTQIMSELDAKKTLWKPTTIHRNFGVLRHVFNTSQTLWEVPLRRNPVQYIKLPKTPKTPIRRLSEDFLEAFESGRRDSIYWVVNFALETAMRRSEIANLRWEDIQREKRLALVVKSKTNRPRFVPLTHKALSILDEVGGQSEYVFAKSSNAIRLAWSRRKASIGHNEVRFHDLRHEAISRLFEKGLTVPEVASISGHSTPQMLFRYAHSDVRALVDKMQ